MNWRNEPPKKSRIVKPLLLEDRRDKRLLTFCQNLDFFTQTLAGQALQIGYPN